jgi:hypothetical protein
VLSKWWLRRKSMNLMGHKSRMLVVCICCILPLSSIPAAAQTNDANENEKLVGTWVNTIGGYHYYKLEITSEVRMINYMKGSDEPYSEARYSVDNKWTDDSGNTYYQCSTRWSWIPFNDSKVYDKEFFLFRIDASGDTMFEAHSGTRMPSDFKSGILSTYKRQ